MTNDERIRQIDRKIDENARYIAETPLTLADDGGPRQRFVYQLEREIEELEHERRTIVYDR